MIAAIADARPGPVIGRHARLELTFEVRQGRSVLSHAYAEPPFRVGRWFAEGSAVHVIMASSAPGIFGGDRFEQTVRVGPGASVRLTSQSAIQVHPSPDGTLAEYTARYEVEDGASLWCHWDPLIPFAGARLTQRIGVRLRRHGSLYWSDAFTAGRQAKGEAWRFAELANEFELWRDEALTYLERYRIMPDDQAPTGRWTAGGASCFGTTLVSVPGLDPAAAENAHLALRQFDGCDAAVDVCDGTLIGRLMAASPVPFRAAREHLARRFSGLRVQPAGFMSLGPEP
jgi:urease accessory protein UreH